MLFHLFGHAKQARTHGLAFQRAIMINNSVFLHNLVLRYLRTFFKSIRIKELSTAFLCMGVVKDFFRVC